MSWKEAGPYQLIWWGWDDLSFGVFGPYPNRPKGDPWRGSIYRWSVRLGPFEVRRWAKRSHP